MADRTCVSVSRSQSHTTSQIPAAGTKPKTTPAVVIVYLLVDDGRLARRGDLDVPGPALDLLGGRSLRLGEDFRELL